INIFGGITRCDDVARGLLAAFAEERPPVPIVIRLTGTNEDAGRALLSGQNLTVARTLEEGAETAVALARIS
ncbi:MAG: succinate--CoA ligase subunit beta, partial [Planctomycetota bacterium]